MDLALELRTPFEALAEQMSEREFNIWNRYALKRLLPTRRLEFYLAQIAMLIARTMGGNSNSTLEDFLISFEEPSVSDSDAVSVEEVQMAFNFNPRKKTR